jgi:hypothetical protein
MFKPHGLIALILSCSLQLLPMTKPEAFLFKLRHQLAKKVWKTVTGITSDLKSMTTNQHMQHRDFLSLVIKHIGSRDVLNDVLYMCLRYQVVKAC